MGQIRKRLRKRKGQETQPAPAPKPLNENHIEKMVRVGGRFTSKKQRELLRLPLEPKEPINVVLRPVSDEEMSTAYENAFLSPTIIKRVGEVLHDGLNSSDPKVAIGTAISRSNDLTRVYITKTKDRKANINSLPAINIIVPESKHE